MISLPEATRGHRGKTRKFGEQRKNDEKSDFFHAFIYFFFSHEFSVVNSGGYKEELFNFYYLLHFLLVFSIFTIFFLHFL